MQQSQVITSYVCETMAALTYSAMHQQKGTIQLFAAIKCPKTDILLQQIAESYHFAHVSMTKLTWPLSVQ